MEKVIYLKNSHPTFLKKWVITRYFFRLQLSNDEIVEMRQTQNLAVKEQPLLHFGPGAGSETTADGKVFVIPFVCK